MVDVTSSPESWVFVIVCLSFAALSFATARRFARSPDAPVRLATLLLFAVCVLLPIAPPSAIVDGNALLGIGGIVLAVGMARSDRSHRAVGAAVVGVGVLSIGLAVAQSGLVFLGDGGRLFGSAVAVYGVGIVAFAAGVLANADARRLAANIVIGVGAASVGLAILLAVKPDQVAKVGQVTLAVGVTVFGIGVIGVSVGLLTDHARSTDLSMLVTGVGGLIAGTGAVLFGLKTIGHGDNVGGMASLLAGLAAIAFGISGVMFGGGRLINHDIINHHANAVFGWAGIGGGTGGVLSGVAIAVSRADRVMSEAGGEALLTAARAVASIGVAAAGFASIALGRRDLKRTSDSFQITPDALRRRGVRPPL